jgi:RNA polymerase sigma-70 factor, ECF subfamily
MASLENEAGLIQGARRGNLDAFNALVLYYQDSMYALAYRIMGEPAAAADAAQEAFITAFRRLDTYRGGNFKSWLLRIATNACYDELRRRKRRPIAAFDDLPGGESDDGPALPADVPTPEQAVQQGELNRAIENCITALQLDQRTVLILSDVEGLSYQEIAESQGVNLGTIKSRLSRARAGVRQCLQAVQELLPTEYRLKSKNETD